MTKHTVKKFSNFLPIDILKECQEFSVNTLYNKRSNFRSSYGWDEVLRRQTTPVLIYELSLHNRELFYKLRDFIEKEIQKPIVDILIQYWSKNSYLDWHTDSNYSDALTIYLNKKWKPEWGGYLLYGPQSDFSGIIPKENLAILQPSGIPHCVTPVLSETTPRVSLQIFINDTKSVL